MPMSSVYHFWVSKRLCSALTSFNPRLALCVSYDCEFELVISLRLTGFNPPCLALDLFSHTNFVF